MATCAWNVPVPVLPCANCSSSSSSRYSAFHVSRARPPPVYNFSSAAESCSGKVRRTARNGALRVPWTNSERCRFRCEERTDGRRTTPRRLAAWAMADDKIQAPTEESSEIQQSSEMRQSSEIQPSSKPSRGLNFDNEVVESKGLTYDGPGKGGQWLSCTTRHVRIYIGVVDPQTQAMDQQQLDKVTLMLDTDNEFIWPEDKVQKVYDYFTELVDAYAGAPCDEYTLRLIGSDIEHYIRKLLLANEIKYNLDCRVLNFSMGKPRYESGIIEEGEG